MALGFFSTALQVRWNEILKRKINGRYYRIHYLGVCFKWPFEHDLPFQRLNIQKWKWFIKLSRNKTQFAIDCTFFFFPWNLNSIRFWFFCPVLFLFFFSCLLSLQQRKHTISSWLVRCWPYSLGSTCQETLWNQGFGLTADTFVSQRGAARSTSSPADGGRVFITLQWTEKKM